jgi:hypothetical protein
MLRGVLVGIKLNFSEWAEGFDDGWNYAVEKYNLEVYEATGGDLNI